MKAFIALFALVALASATPGYIHGHPPAPLDPHSGRVVNTPEVEHAAQVHLAIHAKEASRNGYGYEHEPAPVHYSEGEHVDYIHSPVFTYHGPYAHLEFDHEGRPLDTPEVKHAKALHLAAVAAESAKHGYPSSYP